MHLPRIDPKVSVCIVFVTAMFMSIMDTTIVNVALPLLGRQLGVANTSIERRAISWVDIGRHCCQRHWRRNHSGRVHRY